MQPLGTYIYAITKIEQLGEWYRKNLLNYLFFVVVQLHIIQAIFHPRAISVTVFVYMFSPLVAITIIHSNLL